MNSRLSLYVACMFPLHVTVQYVGYEQKKNKVISTATNKQLMHFCRTFQFKQLLDLRVKMFLSFS